MGTSLVDEPRPAADRAFLRPRGGDGPEHRTTRGQPRGRGRLGVSAWLARAIRRRRGRVLVLCGEDRRALELRVRLPPMAGRRDPVSPVAPRAGRGVDDRRSLCPPATDRQGPLVAVLAYAAMLFPALGFLDVYPMRYSFVADHFQYHTGVALLALIAAGAARSFPRVARRPPLAVASSLPVLVLLGTLTWLQSRNYHDALTLWNDTLSKNPAAWIAHENLGNHLLNLGRIDEAIWHLRTTVELRPDHMQGYSNLGNSFTPLRGPNKIGVGITA
jgi:tetratricopeptide (TPR) repeat protein